MRENKRLKGFEPSTFCMAIRRGAEQVLASITLFCRAFMIEEVAYFPHEYVRIGADMQRFGHSAP
jgi:hypothetical protein